MLAIAITTVMILYKTFIITPNYNFNNTHNENYEKKY